jgi:hypothetical protein
LAGAAVLDAAFFVFGAALDFAFARAIT